VPYKGGGRMIKKKGGEKSVRVVVPRNKGQVNTTPCLIA